MICTGKSLSCFYKIGIVVIAILVSLYLFKGWFPYLFYLRVPVLSGLVLLALPFICLFALPSFLGNLFVLGGKWELAFVIIMSVLAGLAVILLGGVIAANAPTRFDVPPSGFLTSLLSQGTYFADILALALALPTCLFAFILSKNEMGAKNRNTGAIIGAATALVILAIVHALPGNNLGSSIEKVLVYLFSILPIAADRGYIENQHLAYGHLTAAGFFLVALVINIVAFYLFRPNADKNKQRQAAALFYVLEIILVWSAIFSLMTFSLDYFRIPSLILFIVFSALAYKLCKVDHYYTLKGKLPPLPPAEIDSILALQNRLNKYQTGHEHTLVVVCASGGGIQAAGWTARVLAGLQQVFSEEFTRAIGLISSVSGGSVGAMYYLDRFDQGRADPSQLDTIFNAATADSLGATGWGLSYPDLWRFIGAPFLHASPRDRGAAIDLRWKSAMRNPDETLRSLGTKVLSGELPIPVFNSTVVDNGRAYRLSPMNLYADSPALVDFTGVFANYDLDASTAALLSATFPYVSPIARNSNPECDPNLSVFHVADGGFFDNFGVVTAANWLDYVLTQQVGAASKIKRVLLVEIQAFYEKPPALPTEATSQPAGWIMAVLGPLLTIANVRDSTQAQRNSEDVQQLREKWAGLGVDITSHEIAFPPEIPFFDFSLVEGEGRMKSMVRDMQNKVMKEKAYTPPLSWKLTKEQKQAIELGWKVVRDGNDENKVIEGIRKAWEAGR